MKKRAIILITYEEIKEILGLSNEHKILNIIADRRSIETETLEIVLDTKFGFDVVEGYTIPYITLEELKQRERDLTL